MKFFIFVVVVSCIQICAFGATVDEVRKELDRLIEESTKTTQNGILRLGQAASNLQIIAGTIIDGGTVQIDRGANRLLEQLVIIDNSAQAENVNASSCLKSGRGIIVELSDLAYLNLDACVNRFSEQGITAVNKALGQLRIIVDEVFVLERRLEACTTPACYDSLLVNIKFEEIDIPRRIDAEQRLGEDKAEANRLNLDLCGTRAAGELTTHGSKVIDDVNKCVDKLVHPPWF